MAVQGGGRQHQWGADLGIRVTQSRVRGLLGVWAHVVPSPGCFHIWALVRGCVRSVGVPLATRRGGASGALVLAVETRRTPCISAACQVDTVAALFLQGATRCWSAWSAGPCCTTSTSRALCTASPSLLMAGKGPPPGSGPGFVEGWC